MKMYFVVEKTGRIADPSEAIDGAFFNVREEAESLKNDMERSGHKTEFIICEAEVSLLKQPGLEWVVRLLDEASGTYQLVSHDGRFCIDFYEDEGTYHVFDNQNATSAIANELMKALQWADKMRK